MVKKLSIAETRKMDKRTIETNLGEYAKELEELGMDHESACEFISSVMNLGIAAQERWDEWKEKRMKAKEKQMDRIRQLAK